MSELTRTRALYFESRRRGKRAPDGQQPAPELQGRIPRVARLMALAIRLDQLLREGHICSQADMARLGHVSRPRITQILNLLILAPDIQEAVLFLPANGKGRDPIAERDLRPIAAKWDWSVQRQMWAEAMAFLPSSVGRVGENLN